MPRFHNLFEESVNEKIDPCLEKLEHDWPDVLEYPAGKRRDAAIVCSWLYKRHFARNHPTAPTRLIYCLPASSFVETLETLIRGWIEKLGRATQVQVATAGYSQWEQTCDRETILLGTSDVLLSAALNRAGGLSPYRWPSAFGLLSNDCQWVIADAELFEAALPTTVQLSARRHEFGSFGQSPTIWVGTPPMVPTLWGTVDTPRFAGNVKVLKPDSHDWKAGPLAKWHRAAKPLQWSPASAPADLAHDAREAHAPASLTLIILNSLATATAVYDALVGKPKAKPKPAKRAAGRTKAPEPEPTAPDADQPEVIFVHGNYRPADRRARLSALQTPLPAAGRIVVATPAIESGVPLSADKLWTEVAPWPHLVARCELCHGRIVCLDESASRTSGVYQVDTVKAARGVVEFLTDAGPRTLQAYANDIEAARRTHDAQNILRRNIFLDIFSTSLDLIGQTCDVSPFVAEKQTCAWVGWRAFEGWPKDALPALQPEELVPVPIAQLRDELLSGAKGDTPRRAYIWSEAERRWHTAYYENLYAGQVVLLESATGGYTPDQGWAWGSKEPVQPVELPPAPAMSQTDPEPRAWLTVTEATERITTALEQLLATQKPLLSAEESGALREAAAHGLWGKAHPVLQAAWADATPPPPRALEPGEAWAASPDGQSLRQRLSERPVCYALASALAMTTIGCSDLACYLAAAQRGRTRVSIRPLAGEPRPAVHTALFAQGLWDGDRLPLTTLAPGRSLAPADVPIHLMRMGLAPDGQPGWTDRALRLLEVMGPCRLAYLECVLRTAVWRALAAEK